MNRDPPPAQQAAKVGAGAACGGRAQLELRSNQNLRSCCAKKIKLDCNVKENTRKHIILKYRHTFLWKLEGFCMTRQYQIKIYLFVLLQLFFCWEVGWLRCCLIARGNFQDSSRRVLQEDENDSFNDREWHKGGRATDRTHLTDPSTDRPTNGIRPKNGGRATDRRSSDRPFNRPTDQRNPTEKYHGIWSKNCATSRFGSLPR